MVLSALCTRERNDFRSERERKDELSVCALSGANFKLKSWGN
jgi:hypothetical protein